MENTLLPGILMSALSLGCIVFLLAGFRKVLALQGLTSSRRQQAFNIGLTGVIAWLAILGGLAIAGVFRNFTALPPRIMLVPLCGFFITLMLAFSKSFTGLLRSTPAHWLVYFQAFRIFVEILLWQAFEKGLIPVQMTFEGYNFDIITGLLALPAGWMLANQVRYARAIGYLFNIIGLLLLFNIITIAMLSAPTPFRQFMNEPANTIVTTFPFVYLPGVLVVLAFAFHIFSLRQLSLTSNTGRSL